MYLRASDNIEWTWKLNIPVGLEMSGGKSTCTACLKSSSFNPSAPNARLTSGSALRTGNARRERHGQSAWFVPSSQREEVDKSASLPDPVRRTLMSVDASIAAFFVRNLLIRVLKSVSYRVQRFKRWQDQGAKVSGRGIKEKEGFKSPLPLTTGSFSVRANPLISCKGKAPHFVRLLPKEKKIRWVGRCPSCHARVSFW